MLKCLTPVVCLSDAIRLFLHTAVYWKPASSCSKSGVCYAEDNFSEVTTDCLQPLQLLEMEVSYLSRFRLYVHQTVGIFQEQHKYRETAKEKNVSHNLILTYTLLPHAYKKVCNRWINSRLWTIFQHWSPL